MKIFVWLGWICWKSYWTQLESWFGFKKVLDTTITLGFSFWLLATSNNLRHSLQSEREREGRLRLGNRARTQPNIFLNIYHNWHIFLKVWHPARDALLFCQQLLFLLHKIIFTFFLTALLLLLPSLKSTFSIQSSFFNLLHFRGWSAPLLVIFSDMVIPFACLT